MQILLLEKGQGKTRALIELAAREDLYIVCDTPRRAAQIARDALDANLRINFPITWSEFLGHKFHASGIKGFVIDDADRLLTHLCIGVPLQAISVTKES